MKMLLWAFCAALLFAQTSLRAQDNATGHDYLKNKIGRWSVIMTLRPTPDAPPLVVRDLTAERTMVGDFCLHEVLHPSPIAKMPDFQRLSDLAYNVNERRWDYMSIDTRITAGIMYFTYLSADDTSITSFITSFPHPGFGPGHTDRGRAVYMRNVVVKIDRDHDLVKQYWRLTDQPEWLGVQYEYTRIRP
jgi:hypothetical protein